MSVEPPRGVTMDDKLIVGQREAIARIVDPAAFRSRQSLYDYCIRTGDSEEEARETADWAHGKDCEEALTKADAILALERDHMPAAVRGGVPMDNHGNWHPLPGTEVRVSEQSTYYDEGQREPLWVVGTAFEPDKEGLNVTVSDQWPPRPGYTDGFYINRPFKSDDLEPVNGFAATPPPVSAAVEERARELLLAEIDDHPAWQYLRTNIQDDALGALSDAASGVASAALRAITAALTNAQPIRVGQGEALALLARATGDEAAWLKWYSQTQRSSATVSVDVAIRALLTRAPGQGEGK